MPAMQVALSHLNRMLGDLDLLVEHREALLALFDPDADLEHTLDELLGEGSPLGQAVQGVEVGTVVDVLRRLPPTIRDAQRAVVYKNLEREEPYGMTFAWAPAYDHEVTVWESPPTEVSVGWVTVLLKGRYPTDIQPVV